MIINLKKNAEKCYNDLALVIDALQLKRLLSRSEAAGLLDILDLVVGEQRNRELHQALNEFLALEGVPETHEIEEIVKATLIGTNLKLPEDLSQATAIIEELTRERNRILDGR